MDPRACATCRADTRPQEPLEAVVRMPPLQEQDQDCPDSHPVRRQAPVPGAAVDEHCGKAVHEPVRSVGQVRGTKTTTPGEGLMGRTGSEESVIRPGLGGEAAYGAAIAELRLAAVLLTRAIPHRLDGDDWSNSRISERARNGSFGLLLRGGRSSAMKGFRRRVVNCLVALVLVVEGPLRVKFELALALDALLFHVADDARVHGLTGQKRAGRRDGKRFWGRGGEGAGSTYGLLGFLLKVNKGDGADGEEGGGAQGELGGARHGGRVRRGGGSVRVGVGALGSAGDAAESGDRRRALPHQESYGAARNLRRRRLTSNQPLRHSPLTASARREHRTNFTKCRPYRLPGSPRPPPRRSASRLAPAHAPAARPPWSVAPPALSREAPQPPRAASLVAAGTDGGFFFGLAVGAELCGDPDAS